MRLGLVLNPSKGGWERVLDAVTAHARQSRWPEPAVHLTSREETGRSQAAAAVAAGAEIVHPLCDEEWGVRRFFYRAGDGQVVNVLSHR